MERPKHDAFLHSSVLRDKNISTGAKILFADIFTLSLKEEYCFAQNRDFANWYNVGLSVVSKWLKELISEEYITIEKENVVETLRAKAKWFEGKGYGTRQCEWCKCKTTVLHNHHYPIPKRNGGTETVSICPNCHHEFHNPIRKIFVNENKGGLNNGNI